MRLYSDESSVAGAAHPFYTRLNQILDEHDFDGYVEGRGGSCVATHIDLCFACRCRLPIAIGDSVVREIDRVDCYSPVGPTNQSND